MRAFRDDISNVDQNILRWRVLDALEELPKTGFRREEGRGGCMLTQMVSSCHEYRPQQ